jgi:hypothetical protein
MIAPLELNFLNLPRGENGTYLRLSKTALSWTPDLSLICREMKQPCAGRFRSVASTTKEIQMKKFVALLIASAAMVATAYAGEIEGVVKTFDEATKTVTLEDGSAFVLAEGVAVEGVAAGIKVKVAFDDTSKAATAVTVVQ